MTQPVRSGMRLGALGVAGSLLLLALVALFAYAPIFAVDFFWHLKLGQIIAETRAIPRTDLFSAVHPERPYVQFQWLWELLAYGAQRAGGLRGVRVMQVLCLTSSFALLGGVALRALHSRAYAFFLCALALVLFEDRFQARPSATLLGFVACMLPLWFGAGARQPRRAALFALLVSCLWSNLHAGESLLGVACMAALALGDYLESRIGPPQQAARGPAALLLAASVLGVLASPTLLEGMRDWGWSIQPQLASGNKEWRPSYTMLENGFAPSFVLIALAPSAVLLVYVLEQRRLLRTGGARPPLGEWLLCGGLLLLAHQAVRNAFLCLVPLAFMLRRRTAQPEPPRTRRLVAAAALALLLAAFHDHVIEGYGGIQRAAQLIGEDLAPNTFPVELGEFMRETGIEGGVMNDGRWGGYLIWELWPRAHVFVDSRHDLTPEMWPVFLAAHAPGTRLLALEQAYRRWGVELSAFRGPTFPLVRPPPGWQLLYKAGDQELYQRLDGSHAAANLARARGWLSARAPPAGADLAALAVQVGAARWLRAPYQQQLATEARALLNSAEPAEALRGLGLQAGLLFDAGSYADALRLLRLLLARTPHDVRAAYQAVLAALALGDAQEARRWLPVLEEQEARLTAPQRSRLRAIQQTFSSAPPSNPSGVEP